MRLCHWEWCCASYASLSASLQTLGEMDFSHVESGSCISVPSSAVICRRGLARASVMVFARRPCPASNGVQFIAELKAVLWANAIAGRKSFVFLYCASSHLVRHPLRWCMNRSTTALDLGLCDPVVICSIPRYLFIAETTPLTNSGASSLRNDRGTPFWRMSPERSARATLSCFLLARNHKVASLVQRSMATRIYPC